jgi:hemolysin activation/secretion protein
MNIRGYVLDRFWGNTAFYNSNELRYITNLRSYLLNGKIGLLVLYDNGRVWYKPESSGTWHYGYGGGLLLAPFNKFTGTVTYAQSPDGGLVQVRINTFL